MKFIFWFLALGGLLLFNAPFHPEKGKEFSIITYNVWNGFENEVTRRDAFVQWAVQQDVDVIAFQELNGYTQTSFEQLAKRWGHPYAVIVKEDGYPVGISSKHPITNVFKLLDGMHHGNLYAEINGINFFVVHFSPFNSTKRLEEAHAVINVLEKIGKLTERTIVLGDFNAFSPQDSLFYVGTGARDSMYLRQQNNKILRNLNDREEIDYQVIGSFLEKGFFNGFSLFNKKFEASYPTKVFSSVPLSANIKIDHILISKNLKNVCGQVEVIKDPATDTLSDHYPLRANFRLR